MKRLLLICILILIWSNTYSQLIPFNKNGKWGFSDINGKIMIIPIYDEVQEFTLDGIAKVKLDNKWGAINNRGEVEVALIFNDNRYFSVKNNIKVYFDENSNEIIIDNSINKYTTKFLSKNLNINIINSNLIEIVSSYNIINEDNIEIVDEYTLINSNADIIISRMSYTSKFIYNDNYFVNTSDTTFTWYNNLGQSKSLEGNVVGFYKNNILVIKSNLYGAIDFNNNLIIPLKYDELHLMFNKTDTILTYENGAYNNEAKYITTTGYFNKSFKEIELNKGSIVFNTFNDNNTFTYFDYSNELEGKVDLNGGEILKNEYDLEECGNNINVSKVNNKYQLINDDGKLILNDSYDGISVISDSIVILREFDKYYTYDIYNMCRTIDFEFNDYIQFFDMKYILIVKGDKKGLISTNGKLVLDTVYDDIFSTNILNVYKVKRNNIEYYININGVEYYSKKGKSNYLKKKKFYEFTGNRY